MKKLSEKEILAVLNHVEKTGAAFFDRTGTGFNVWVRGVNGNDPAQWENARKIKTVLGYCAGEIIPDAQSGHLLIKVVAPIKDKILDPEAKKLVKKLIAHKKKKSKKNPTYKGRVIVRDGEFYARNDIPKGKQKPGKLNFSGMFYVKDQELGKELVGKIVRFDINEDDDAVDLDEVAKSNPKLPPIICAMERGKQSGKVYGK